MPLQRGIHLSVTLQEYGKGPQSGPVLNRRHSLVGDFVFGGIYFIATAYVRGYDIYPVKYKKRSVSSHPGLLW